MREILFRAKRKNWRRLSKEEWWVEGVPIEIKGKMYMAVEYVASEQITDFETAQYILQKIFVEIAPKTLCQYTGLPDKNGNRIWENDIVRSGTNMVVKWSERFAGWCLYQNRWMYEHFFGEAVDERDCEVVGNVFDNPELLKK